MVSNKDGLFTEKPSMLDKYQRRSIQDNLHISKLTYLQFCMKYMSSNQEPGPSGFQSLSFDTNQQEFQLTDDMELIVTHDFLVNKVQFSLPRYIKLENLKPGEPKFMKKKSRCVVRFHKINKTTSPHEYYYSSCSSIHHSKMKMICGQMTLRSVRFVTRKSQIIMEISRSKM